MSFSQKSGQRDFFCSTKVPLCHHSFFLWYVFIVRVCIGNGTSRMIPSVISAPNIGLILHLCDSGTHVPLFVTCFWSWIFPSWRSRDVLGCFPHARMLVSWSLGLLLVSWSDRWSLGVLLVSFSLKRLSSTVLCITSGAERRVQL